MMNELEIQEKVLNKLLELELIPFSVIFTYSVVDTGLLSISFFAHEHLDTLLDMMDYKIQCDKSGYTIINESNTILLTGIALIKLYSELL